MVGTLSISLQCICSVPAQYTTLFPQCDGLNGADSGCATDLSKMLSSDSGGLRGSRSDDLRMGGRKGKAVMCSKVLRADLRLPSRTAGSSRGPAVR